MMIDDMYITLFVGLVVGWFIKTIEYRYSKKALRDKKFLEGKIDAYHNMFTTLGEMYAEYIGLFDVIENDDSGGESEHVDRLLALKQKFNAQFFMFRLYGEKATFVTLWNIFQRILRVDLSVGENRLNNKKQLFEDWGNFNLAIGDFRNAVREDLGFKKEQKIDYSKLPPLVEGIESEARKRGHVP